MGPVAMLRPPSGASSQTQPDGRFRLFRFPFQVRTAGHRPFPRAPAR